MTCSQCRQENPPQAKFCLECGSALARPCPNCGRPIPPSAKFCPECAHPLGAPSPERAVEAGRPRFASLESYTPKHLAEKIITSRTALEGERKQVTVLFADLKGSMELLAGRDPEDARGLLDPVLEQMMEAVHFYEGTVNQVMGDGIMALFGAPVAHEDHAIRACYAAFRMQDAVRRGATDTGRSHGVEVQIRVGLNSGEVVVRSIGSDLRMDYTAVGQTTHLAARMEQLAAPGTTWLTGETLGLAEGYVQAKSLGPMPVKGLSHPVEAYQLTGPGPVRTRLQASAARGLSHFVGRTAEVEQLGRALARAREGHGQVAAVVGEAGVGKSRLFYEFITSQRSRGWRILESASVSYGKATSSLPVIELLRSYFNIQERDDEREMRAKVTERLVALDAGLQPWLSPLLALLGLPPGDARWDALDPPQRRRLTLDAVKRLLLRQSQAEPLMLVFEDLQWIDSETQALLDTLVESLPTARLLLLVNYRPEYQHGWGNKTCYSQMRLEALPPENAGKLLQELLGADPNLEPLEQLLVTRTEGNPFFLEESVRSLVETGVLAGVRGAYRLTQPAAAVRVPATVQAVLAARIDRLPSEEKHLLQAASVIGKDLPFALLRAVAERPEELLRRGLAQLQAAELLYETSLFPDLEYTFKHALTHEVAYGSLLQERRRDLHGRTAEAIEDLYGDRLDEHVERLGRHALRGELWDKAVHYLRRAGAKAFERSANREAVEWFDQALVALARHPDTPETTGLAIDLRLELRNPLTALGQFERFFEVLREAERLAEALGDQRRLALVLGYLTGGLALTGDLDRAVESGARTLVIADAVGDLPGRVVATTFAGMLCLLRGEWRGAVDVLDRSRQLLQGDSARGRFGLTGFPAVMVRAWLAMSLAELGEFGEGVALGEEGVRMAEALRHPYSRIFAAVGLGYLYVRKGDHETALRPLEQAVALTQTMGISVLFPHVASFLGWVYARSGRMGEGVSFLEQAVEKSASMRLTAMRSHFAGLLGEAYLLAGRIDDAIRLGGRALDLARAYKERGWEAWGLRLLGDVNSCRGARAAVTARDAYRRAQAVGEELGMRPLVAQCYLGVGQLGARTGERSQARESLMAALAMFREMDMRSGQAMADAALAEMR